MNPSASQVQSAPFEQLLDPLFVNVCYFLSMDEKSTTLLLLNKHPRFHPRWCMQSDSIRLIDDALTENKIARLINRLKFASFVRSIELNGSFQQVNEVLDSDQEVMDSDNEDGVPEVIRPFHEVDFIKLLRACCIGAALVSAQC